MSGLTLKSQNRSSDAARELPEGVEFFEDKPGAFRLTVVRGIYERVILIPAAVLQAGSATEAHLNVEVGEASRVRFELNGGDLRTPLRIFFHIHDDAYVDAFYLDGHADGGARSIEVVYELGKRASLNAWTFATGGSARIRHIVEFKEPHAFAALRGLSLLKDASEVVHGVEADHRVGHCVSRQFYKSILTGSSKSSFASLVRVDKGAEKSDSKQLNKNLLLSDKATAVSLPELEIDTDDVSCAHGSATGQLRPEELFYLRSRGIAEKTARFLMIEGFAEEILEEVPEIPLKARLQAIVRDKITQLAVL